MLLVATGTLFGYRTGTFPPIPDVNLPALYGFARWDAGYYLGMAENGYGAFPQQQAYAFRPLFPLIIGALAPLFVGLDVRPAEVLAGFVWNLFAVVMIGFFLFRVTKILLGADVAGRTLLLLGIFPSTIFLSAIYTEATNLLLIVVSLYLLETDRVLLAGLTGFAAGMVRPETFLLSVPFFIRWLVEGHNAGMLVASISTFLSLPAFAVFSYYETGNFLLELQIQRAWPKCTLYCFLSNPIYQLSRDTLSFTINFATIALAVVFIAYPLLKGEASSKLLSYYLWAFILIAVVFYVGNSGVSRAMGSSRASPESRRSGFRSLLLH